jgi:hypothetical protein
VQPYLFDLGYATRKAFFIVNIRYCLELLTYLSSGCQRGGDKGFYTATPQSCEGLQFPSLPTLAAAELYIIHRDQL